MNKSVPVKNPTTENPYPQGVYTRIKLPDSCVIVDGMDVIFAPGAGVHADMLITIRGIQLIDGTVSRFERHIEMADFADFVENRNPHQTFLSNCYLSVQNAFTDTNIATRLCNISDIAGIMPNYIPADAAETFNASLAGSCSEWSEIYGKLEYVLNNQN